MSGDIVLTMCSCPKIHIEWMLAVWSHCIYFCHSPIILCTKDRVLFRKLYFDRGISMLRCFFFALLTNYKMFFLPSRLWLVLTFNLPLHHHPMPLSPSPLWVPLCDSRKWDTNGETWVRMRCFADKIYYPFASSWCGNGGRKDDPTSSRTFELFTWRWAGILFLLLW